MDVECAAQCICMPDGFRMCVLQCEPWLDLPGTCKTTGLPAFLQSFFHEKFYNDSTIAVEHAVQLRGHFAVVKACETKMPCQRSTDYDGFRPIFIWLHDTVIPRDPSLPEWLQPTPCAYADDLAVSALRTLVPASALAFRTTDVVTGMSLDHR